MSNLNLNFLKDLFKVGMTKEQFIGAYSEMFNETGVTDEQLEGMSIFDADKKEAVAGGLFDMLNINKAANGKEDVLDADEIAAFANLDKTDGENNLTASDMNVLLKDYKKRLESDMKLDTPEKMYNDAMAKPAENGDAVQSYMHSLDFQISALERFINDRQLSSNQLLQQYQNDINTLVQEDTNISSELKAKFNKATTKLNQLIAQQNNLDTQMKAKQSEINNANSNYQNLQANIEHSQNSDGSGKDYSSDLAGSEKLIKKLNAELATLQADFTSVGAEITKVKTDLKTYETEAKTQSTTLKSKIDNVNKRIEQENKSCKTDIENYNTRLKGLKDAQSYAIERAQSEAAANAASFGNGDDTYVYDESNYDAAAIAALEQRWSSKGAKYGMDHKFFVKVTAIAHDLKCDPNALMAVMNSECGLNPAAHNKNGGASGLIQFMPRTAKVLGTTTNAIRNMSAYDQLDYVAKFFELNRKTFKMGDGPMSAADLYSLIFLPARANREVLTSKGENYYSANAALDMDGDGKITKSDMARRVQKFMV